MKNFQEKVKEFQIASGQPVYDAARVLTPSEHDFRDNLFREEVRELFDAVIDSNRVEILDALCDIKYVTDGVANMTYVNIHDSYFQGFYIENYISPEKINIWMSALNDCQCDEVIKINTCVYELASAFGFTLENFLTALDRVHLSNISKFCIDTKTAEKTKQFYLNQGIETIAEVRNKVTVVYRKEDRKVLKSVEYHPVILNDLI